MYWTKGEGWMKYKEKEGWDKGKKLDRLQLEGRMKYSKKDRWDKRRRLDG